MKKPQCHMCAVERPQATCSQSEQCQPVSTPCWLWPPTGIYRALAEYIGLGNTYFVGWIAPAS
jgi:hypothetical protein